MPEKQFVQAIVQHQLGMEKVAAEMRPRAEEFARHLEENPADRDPSTFKLWINKLKAEDLKSSGSKEYANMTWDPVAKLAQLSLTDLDKIPVPSRGTFWKLARQLILAITEYQAKRDVGAFATGLIDGAIMGAKQGPMSRVIPRENLKNGLDIKGALKAERKRLLKESNGQSQSTNASK